MKSSIRVHKNGHSITFRGGAARAAFEAITGTKLPGMPEQHRPEPKGPSSNEGHGRKTEMQADPAGRDNVAPPSSNPRTP